MTDRELMQQALNLLDDINQCSLPPTGIPLPAEIDHVMEALRARLAQPEPEPVAQVQVAEDYHAHVIWMEAVNPVDLDQKFLYTAPPQREFIGLTDEEIEKLFVWQEWSEDFADYEPVARAIEAKLKEKNNG